MIALQDKDFTLHQGDVNEVLASLPDRSVDCCVTSPPYWNQRDYSTEGQLGLEDTPDQYIEAMVNVFAGVKRVLADHGTLWLNIGDSYAANRSYQVKDSKHTDVGNAMPARVPAGLKPKDLVGIPWMLAFALRADGWWLRSEIIWSKPNVMPESVHDRPTTAHEHLFLLAKSRDYYYDKIAVKEDAEWERWGYQTSPKYGTDSVGKAGFIKERSKRAIYEYVSGHGDKGMTRNLRNVWTITTEPYEGAHFATFPQALVEPCVLAGCPNQVCVTCNAPKERIVERIPTGFDGSRYGERAVEATGGAKTGGTAASTLGSGGGKLTADHETAGWTDCGHANYRAGVVLDPFIGTGTTCLVARKHGRHSVGIELNPESIKLCAERTRQLSLLS